MHSFSLSINYVSSIIFSIKAWLNVVKAFNSQKIYISFIIAIVIVKCHKSSIKALQVLPLLDMKSYKIESKENFPINKNQFSINRVG